MRIFLRRWLTGAGLFLGVSTWAAAQVDTPFLEEVRQSGYVHSPLPLHPERGLESAFGAKRILSSRILCDMESLSGWSHKGVGSMALTDLRSKDGRHSLRLQAPSHPEGMPDWGLGRGTSLASLELPGENWEESNRLHFFVYPSCAGARSIYLNLYLENDGAVKVPDPYGREGYHELNLRNEEWNECFLEITGLSRDRITKLSFAIEVFGREQTMGDTLCFDIDAVSLEKVADPEVVKGWIPGAERIVYSTSGYTPQGEKTALTTVSGHHGRFYLEDADSGKRVFSGTIRKVDSPVGSFQQMDFTAFRKPGQYRLRVGERVTPPFHIHRDLWLETTWRTLNFLFCERCGYPVPSKHGTCHTDLNAPYAGGIVTLNGGWHDAGDQSQQTLQTGEIAYSLLQASLKAKQRGLDDLSRRLEEESLWGLDYVLRTRLGGGDRILGWGTNLWTDGVIGTVDDAGGRNLQIHPGALENFILSGIEAYAAMELEGDEGLRRKLAEVAVEDYDAAMERFSRLGFAELKEGRGRGHASMASESQYRANMSWAASMLYKLTRERRFAEDAVRSMEYVLACQRTEPLPDRDGTCGFFYRDTTRRSIVHYNHQSREYCFMEALEALCQTQPDHPAASRWLDAVRLYGNYLKGLMQYIAPYGMLPSGVYSKDEIKDEESFYATQIWIDEDVTHDFLEQLHHGVDLDGSHFVRRFPVWFSFKGNTAVSLASGKSAAICARILRDETLMHIAEAQLQWVVGLNPFGQSLIYGEGYNYPQLYNALPGEMTGEVPVGMQSYFNEDAPYWPQFNTATYKEVWGSSAARWLMLVSEF